MSEEEHSSAVAGAASAAKNDKKNDRFAARKRQAIEQLTSVYGFSCSLAEEAVELVSYDGSFSMNDVFAMTRTTTTTTTDAAAVDKLVVASYTYILDHHLAPDQGGPVVPVDCCPHLSQHCCITGDQMPLRPRVAPCTHGAASSPSSFSSSNTSGKAASNGTAASSLAVGVAARQKSAVTWDDNGIATVCPATENWVCLECGVVRCSRYCNGHALHHWQETAAATAATLSTTEATNNETASQLSASAAAEGHCVIISLSDLSVWCHLCNAYLSTSTGATGKTLRPLVEALGRNKFRTETDIGAAAIVRQPNEQQQPDTKRLRSMKEVEEEEEDDDDREDEDDLHDEALRGATNGKTHSSKWHRAFVAVRLLHACIHTYRAFVAARFLHAYTYLTIVSLLLTRVMVLYGQNETLKWTMLRKLLPKVTWRVTTAT